jgi:sn-glycerol 3-phosphate transport system substrate-binding protein
MKQVFVVMALIVAAWSAQAQEVTLRHALAGRNLETLDKLVTLFNQQQKKGKARIVLQDLKQVGDRHQLPHMALLDSNDGMAFFATLPRYRPLYQVMKEAGQKFSGSAFYPQISDAMNDSAGRMQALPMGLSLPVLFRNKALFQKAGLEPDRVPQTWHDVQLAAAALNEAGVACPFTSSRFSWVHLENVSSQQGHSMLARPNRATFNGLINVKHLALLATWYRSNYFRYYGANSEADSRFLSGECAMLTGQSSLYSDILAEGNISVGVSRLPYYDDEFGAAQDNVLPDGAGLWILAGKSREEYRLMARFVSYLMQPAIQRDWVKGTGFLPMTATAIAALHESGVPPSVLDAAVRRLSMRSSVTRVKSGPLLARVREMIDDEVGYVWRDQKPAKEALDSAMQRANDGSADGSVK